MQKTLIALGLMVAATTANAACINANMAGMWRSYVAEAQMGWSTCRFTLNHNGGLSGTSTNGNNICKTPQGQVRVSAGVLQVSGGCEIRGYLVIGGVRNSIVAAALNQDRTEAHGLIRLDNITTTFHALKF
jgi:hypothetical protein